MNVLITGASGGIGAATAERFLSLGHEVYGLDLQPAVVEHERYHHVQADIRDKEALPRLPDLAVIVHAAGVQNSGHDIETNLIGAMNVTESYESSPALRSILFTASSSSVTGREFPAYAASKAGLVGYMKNTAIRLAPRGVTCNAISPGGVLTALNEPVMKDPVLWEKIMRVTPLKKWMTPEEVADWVIFLTLTNRSMSGQNLLIDNGEADLNDFFVWPEQPPTDCFQREDDV